MSKQEFEPIIMTGCNEEKVAKTESKNYRIPFSLSDKPSRDWEKFFNELWCSRRKQNSEQRAKAYIRKNALVLVSPLSDVSFHFDNLKADIEAANKQYSEYIQRKNGKKSKREDRLIAEREAIKKALEGLSFS